MVERKNRHLKTRLNILFGNEHPSWPEKLPSIRFAMNKVACSGTGWSVAYLTFGRELFAPQSTPKGSCMQLYSRKTSSRRSRQGYWGSRTRCGRHARLRRHSSTVENHTRTNNATRLLVLNHTLSNVAKEVSAKLAPKRDGP